MLIQVRSKKNPHHFNIGSPAASPQSSDNSDTHQSGGSDIEMDEQLINRTKHVQQRLSDTEV